MCKCLPNYCDPAAPEYQKPWKPANNSSCSGAACLPRSCDCSQTINIQTEKKGCFLTIKNCFKNTYQVGQKISRKSC